MTQADQLNLSAFVEELYLEYLRLHSVWGCPVRIPAAARLWAPHPSPTRITARAARAFRDRVEAAARGTAPSEKQGGLTYADETRRLWEVVEAAVRTGAPAGPDRLGTWGFALRWQEEVAILDVPAAQRITAPAPTPAAPEAEEGGTGLGRPLARRGLLSLVAAAPAALVLASEGARGADAGAPPRVPPSEATGLVAAGGAPILAAAAALSQLGTLPWADRYAHACAERLACPEARLRELDAGPFVSAATLVQRLIDTQTGTGSHPMYRAGALRDLARAQTAQHVRFHASTAGLLLARLRRYAATGTTWYAPDRVTHSPWDGLVMNATFDLRNFCASLRMRDECVVAADDALTFANEIQVTLGPLLLRIDRGHSRLLGPTLCAWVPPRLRSVEAEGSAPVTYIWLVSDEGARAT
ncbi:hypothetical protein SAMN04488144_13211 [Methylobacterium sp. 190mf]|uniref:hypothetical protein n=1 Tax=Methylobacterium sp. 190mf TaxID=1761798 RepID=UPI00089E34E3|nr:hypothetical protein [Methylobacterium sp. 190mf]SEG64346.1 hypothetical protein SAMN04488144_13211 [Methylobacterium sp. 190mf]